VDGFQIVKGKKEEGDKQTTEVVASLRLPGFGTELQHNPDFQLIVSCFHGQETYENVRGALKADVLDKLNDMKKAPITINSPKLGGEVTVGIDTFLCSDRKMVRIMQGRCPSWRGEFCCDRCCVGRSEYSSKQGRARLQQGGASGSEVYSYETLMNLYNLRCGPDGLDKGCDPKRHTEFKGVINEPLTEFLDYNDGRVNIFPDFGHDECNILKQMLKVSEERLSKMEEKSKTNHAEGIDWLLNPEWRQDLSSLFATYHLGFSVGDMPLGSSLSILHRDAKVFRDPAFLARFFEVLGLHPWEASHFEGGMWQWLVKGGDDKELEENDFVQSWLAWANMWGDEGVYAKKYENFSLSKYQIWTARVREFLSKTSFSATCEDFVDTLSSTFHVVCRHLI
jgi:hypothetical protein